jgi:hypothetical protein
VKLLILAGVAGAAAALGAAFGAAAQPHAQTAASASAAPHSCFLMRNLRNHIVADPTTVYLDVDGTDIYRVKTDKACLAGAISTEPMAIQSFGSGQICTRQDLEIVVRGNHCVIDSVSKMTPAEVAAIPPRLRP